MTDAANEDWIPYGECVVTDSHSSCGQGVQLKIRSCFQRGMYCIDDLMLASISYITGLEFIKSV